MTSPQLQLIELLDDAADNPGGPQLAVLSNWFIKLLRDKFGLRDPHSHLPQFVQLEIPLWHVAEIAHTLDGISSRRNAYVEALGFGIGHLHKLLGPLDEDVLRLWLSCTRPEHAEQLALVYKEEWCKFPKPRLEGLQRLLTEYRLRRLLKRGLFEKDGEDAASKALLGWISFLEIRDQKRDAHTFSETLLALRSSFFYDVAKDWRGLTEERCRCCLKALAGGLFLLRERNRRIDLLVLRMLIHWRPWLAPGQVVAAYDSLEGISEFLPAAFIESRLYNALSKAGVERLRMPNELVQVGVASIARSATTFLCYKEPEGLPTGEILCRWIEEAVETVFHRPLLAIACAQESLLPPGKRSRGKPRTLKLLPFLQSHSELARQEKHLLLKDLPRLLSVLGNFAPNVREEDTSSEAGEDDTVSEVWDDDTISQAVRLLFQGIAYEWHDRDEDEIQPFDLPKIRRLKKTRELLKQIRRKVPALPRFVVRTVLDEEIVLLDKRLQPA